MPIERLCGAIVFARDLPAPGAARQAGKKEIYLALVHDVFGRWTLSKGHIGENEDGKSGVVRVVKEELGLDGTSMDELGKNEYIASQPEKGKVRKQVTYYLVEAPFEELELKDTGGLDDARWFKLADILDLNFYDDMLPIVTKAINILVDKNRIAS